MIIVVTGGRDYSDTDRLYGVLDRMHAVCPIEMLGQGGALGADLLANQWATTNRVQSLTFMAQWRTLGRGAGSIRNGRMLRVLQPDVVVAFPGGPGTFDCVSQARAMGIWVLEIDHGTAA